MGRPGQKLDRLGLASQSTSLFDQPSAQTLPAAFDRNSPEASYCASVPLEHRKRYAQFFTPQPIARLMAEWVAAIAPATVLDPACGPGIFPRVLRELSPAARITAVDVDAAALEACRHSLPHTRRDRFVGTDFLLWKDSDRFDGILANPPYLRHHDIHYPFDIFDEFSRRGGVRLSRLSNIYVLFVIEICRRLKPGGRAAIIVPGEWTNANFGGALKRYLLSNGLLRWLLYFSHAGKQFEDALTTAAILLVESPAVRLGTFQSVYVEEDCTLERVRAALEGSQPELVRTFDSDAMSAEAKWDAILRYGPPQPRPGFVPLSELATSRRGIATGANSFFHLTPVEAREHGIRPGNLLPCIGKAEDARGAIFSQADFDRLLARNRRCLLFDLRRTPNAREQAYLDEGVRRGLPERFLLAARKPWYTMERREPAPIWAAVFSRGTLRFVLNSAGVANLSTFHCLYPRNAGAHFAAALAACLNSAEVQSSALQQSRVYGGGLRKVEPRDLLAIQVPDLRLASNETIKRLAAQALK